MTEEGHKTTSRHALVSTSLIEQVCSVTYTNNMAIFMVQCTNHGCNNALWLVDSGCSNYMTGDRGFFRNLDENFTLNIHLGDNIEITVKGKGTVALSNLQGGFKLLYNVQYVMGLAHNLLSIGQLLSNGYFILFADNTCTIADLKTEMKVISIPQTQNNMFPLNVASVGSLNIVGEV